MTRRIAAVAVCLAVAAACGGGGDDGEDAASTTDAAAGESGGTEVAIVDFNFDPEPIEVEAGATVMWTNEDDAAHSVEGDGDLEYESDDLDQGDTFEQTFDEPGEFPYICGIHSYMRGTVVVS